MRLPTPNHTIMHIDLNSFFASAEQQANPFLRNRAMGVGNRGYAGSAILAASYPAKRQGIGLGTRYHQAKQIDPTFELATMDHIKYYDLHNKFIDILNRYSPNIEVYSIDEAFLDFTKQGVSLEGAAELSYEIKDTMIKEMGEVLTCSIGLANNKLLAKIASNHDKPDGITIINWQDRFNFLDNLRIEDVWGIGRHVSYKMYKRGINTVKELRELTDRELYSIVGGYYTRLRLLTQGYHFEPVKTQQSVKPPKSMQHAHTLQRATNNKNELKSLARKMSERLAIRLRTHRQKTASIYVGFAPANLKHYGWDSQGWYGQATKLAEYTNHGYDIYQACIPTITQLDLELVKIRRIVVGVYELSCPDMMEFKDLAENKATKIDEAFDQINDRFGSFTIRTADILHQYAKESELGVSKHEMRFHTS